MRLLFLVAALATMLSQDASAAGALPQFRRDTPYPQVRAQMIKQGFEPARVLKRSEASLMGCGLGEPDVCKRWPEILHCSQRRAFCDFLFFRKRDGARVLVVTEGDNDVYNCYCFFEVRWPDGDDSWKLREAVIAKPSVAASPGPANALPRIRKGTRYKAARAQMIAAGFHPRAILERPSDEANPCNGPGNLCREAPEMLTCAVNGICAYLYARDSDGAFAVVIAWSETGGYFTGVRWADSSDLADIRRHVIAKPAPRDRPRGP